MKGLRIGGHGAPRGVERTVTQAVPGARIVEPGVQPGRVWHAVAGRRGFVAARRGRGLVHAGRRSFGRAPRRRVRRTCGARSRRIRDVARAFAARLPRNRRAAASFLGVGCTTARESEYERGDGRDDRFHAATVRPRTEAVPYDRCADQIFSIRPRPSLNENIPLIGSGVLLTTLLAAVETSPR